MTRRTRAGSRLNKKMDQNNNIISNDLDHQTFIHGTDPLMTDDIYTPEHSPSKNATKNQKKTTTGVEIAEDTEETELFPSPIAQQQPTEPATVVPPLIRFVIEVISPLNAYAFRPRFPQNQNADCIAPSGCWSKAGLFTQSISRSWFTD